jgi:hypothetical protein
MFISRSLVLFYLGPAEPSAAPADVAFEVRFATAVPNIAEM